MCARAPPTPPARTPLSLLWGTPEAWVRRRLCAPAFLTPTTEGVAVHVGAGERRACKQALTPAGPL